MRCLAGDLLNPDYAANTGDRAVESEGPGGVLRYFGDYEFLEALARGGMGVVYRARQVSLNREVAVKMLAATGARNAAVARRFRVEAEAAARLQHPHIIPIYEYGEYGGEPFLSMKFVAGARTLVDPTLPFADALDHFLDVTGAVHHAHLHGVLHRDIKPSNVLVGADGVVSLMDFGLAKLTDGAGSITQTRETLGTPAYMAPELAEGGAREATVSADVYGLGAILYEILTGRPPFVGETTAAVVRQVVEDDPVPPSRIHASARAGCGSRSVDRDLETITLKCLHKTPSRRYASAQALAEDLGRWRRGEPIQARPVSTLERSAKWVRRRPFVAATVLFAVLGLLGVTIASVMFGRERAQESERHRRERVRLNVSAGLRLVEQRDPVSGLKPLITALRLDALDPNRELVHRLRVATTMQESPGLDFVLSHAGPVNSIEFSPDGRLLLSASDDGAARLWDAAEGVVAVPPLNHGARVYQACFSPDGRRVLTLGEDGRARLWEAESGRSSPSDWPVMLPRYKQVTLPPAFFTRDSGRVVCLHASQVDVWEVATGKAAAPSLELASPAKFAALSPDGNRVLVAGTEGPVEIRSLDPAAGWSRLASSAIRRPIYGWFDPTGERFAVIEADYSVRIWSARTGAALTPSMRHPTTLRLQQCAFSPDGGRLLTVSFDNTVRTWDAATGALLTRAIRHAKGVASARFHPDGRQIVTTSFDGSARLWEADSGEATGVVMRHSSYVFDAAFDPVRNRVATAGQDGEVRIWSPPRGRVKSRWQHGARLGLALPWPDGRGFLTGGLDGKARFWELPGGSGPEATLSVGGDLRWGAVDPRGKWLALATAQGPVQVFVRGREWEGQGALRVPSPITCLRPSADGRWLAVAAGAGPAGGERGGVRVYDTARWGQPTVLLEAGEPISDVQFSPTGDSLAAVSEAARVRFFSLPNFTARGSLEVSGRITKIHYREDGRRVVTAAAEEGYRASEARLWSAPAGEPIGLPMRHDDGVMDALFSPDSRLVATAGEDATTRVWEGQFGVATPVIMAHDYKVVRLAYSPNSRLLATATTSGAVRIWEARTGEAITRPVTLPSPLVGFWFTSDARELVIAMTDGAVESWDLTPAAQSVDDLEALAGRLNADRRPRRSTVSAP